MLFLTVRALVSLQPLYFLEMSIGQFSSFTCVKVWRMVPAAKGSVVGYSTSAASRPVTAGLASHPRLKDK
ncbi:hypothetical protein E2C01_051679 [Portunus trituberculatus]|uniref:Uncharacterized protein n=1 Tax=Portunus trituberculatus TaxID=210409 RepID=A0A5B7GFI7_PORTR|nr:hypothetical protein [Portunus trituberculatus]